ncbi:MAG: hypothetical protein ACXACA_03755 [Candidatus Ranarchaeia archaeon]
MIRDGLKIPIDSYLEGRLRTALDGVLESDFLRDSDQDAINNLKKHKLLTKEFEFTKTTLAGQKVLEVLDGLGLTDDETIPLPMGTYLYGATSIHVQVAFPRILPNIEPLADKLIKEYDTEEFRQSSFVLDDLETCTLLDLRQKDPEFIHLAHPNVPMEWLLHDSDGSILTMTVYSRTKRPMHCVSNSAILGGMFLTKNRWEPYKVSSSVGIHVEESIY